MQRAEPGLSNNWRRKPAFVQYPRAHHRIVTIGGREVDPFVVAPDCIPLMIHNRVWKGIIS